MIKSLVYLCLFLGLSASAFAQPDFGAVIDGPILIENTPGHIIMKSGDGSYWTLTVDGSGQLQTTAASFTKLDVTISNSQTYTTDVFVGDEESVVIFLQADNFLQSEIEMNASTNWAHRYSYKPLGQFIGTDEVSLLIATGSTGASPNTHFEYRTIHFTITN